MNTTARARQLRRDQTDEEKQLWRAVKAGRFAGFKFRRQHPVGKYFLDCYCPLARLAVELDGFQHGLPGGIQRDAERERFLVAQDIEVLRFWNHQWNKNRHGVLLEIWHALHRRTGCVKLMRKEQNHRFAPPKPQQFVGEAKPLPRLGASSPQPSPPSAGGEGEERRVETLSSLGGRRGRRAPG
jgi:very-short-patch-repair endonuclease